jgi:hypothetical protein
MAATSMYCPTEWTIVFPVSNSCIFWSWLPQRCILSFLKAKSQASALVPEARVKGQDSRLLNHYFLDFFLSLFWKMFLVVMESSVTMITWDFLLKILLVNSKKDSGKKKELWYIHQAYNTWHIYSKTLDLTSWLLFMDIGSVWNA